MKATASVPNMGFCRPLRVTDPKVFLSLAKRKPTAMARKVTMGRVVRPPARTVLMIMPMSMTMTGVQTPTAPP